MPVNCSTLLRREDEARSAKRGTVDLAFCQFCGMIFNAAFDHALLDYDGGYENLWTSHRHFNAIPESSYDG